MSTIIKVRCIDQVLTFENTPVIASGGLEVDYVSFSFCSKWADLTRTAVFWRSEAEAYHVLLDESNLAAIPREVLTQEGMIYFGVFGVNDAGKRRPTNVLSYRVGKGAITEGTQPTDPTPEIYTQLLAAYAEVGPKAEAAVAACNEAAAKVDDRLAVLPWRVTGINLENWTEGGFSVTREDGTTEEYGVAFADTQHLTITYPDGVEMEIVLPETVVELVEYTEDCTVLEQAGYNDGEVTAYTAAGWTAYGSVSQYAGRNSSEYYACILHFKTPAFTGTAKKLQVTIGTYYGYGESGTLRWTLAKSDANKASYVYAAADTVADEHAIVSGITELTGIDYTVRPHTFEIDTAQLEPETDYYLYLWASANDGLMFIAVQDLSNQAVTLTWEGEA